MALPWGAIGQIGGALLGGLFGSSGQSSANRANLQIAREQMAFQERMSSTAMQRAAQDAEKAGLNRILALGSPASTPPGQTATMQNVKAKGIEAAAAGASIAKLLAETKQVNANTKLIETKTDTIKPASEIGDTIGTAIENAKTNSPDSLYNIARDKVTDLFELLDVGGHNKMNQLRQHSAKPAPNAKLINDLQRQIEQDEKWLKIYKNEDVDNRQVQKRLRNARFQLKLLQQDAKK